MHGAHNTCRNACIPSQKMHMPSGMRAYATVQKLLCHGSYCKLILSLARASVRLSSAARPPAASTKSVARRCSLKKSVRIHASSWRHRRCGVAQASFDHPRWCRPHPVCLRVALEAWSRSSPITEIYFHYFCRKLCINQKFLLGGWLELFSSALMAHSRGPMYFFGAT